MIKAVIEHVQMNISTYNDRLAPGSFQVRTGRDPSGASCDGVRLAQKLRVGPCIPVGKQP